MELKAVNYEGVIPLLVESIKEQQSTIENLKDRINKLEGQIMFYKVVLKSVV